MQFGGRFGRGGDADAAFGLPAVVGGLGGVRVFVRDAVAATQAEIAQALRPVFGRPAILFQKAGECLGVCGGGAAGEGGVGWGFRRPPTLKGVEDGNFAALSVGTGAGGRAVVQGDVAATPAACGQRHVEDSGADGVDGGGRTRFLRQPMG